MDALVKIDNRQFAKTLAAIAVPIALQMLVSGSFTLVDNVMVGSLGELALTSTGLATQIFSVHWMMVFGFCTGCSTFFSQFWGTKDVKNIKKVIGIGWSACLAASVVFFAASVLAPQRVLGLFTDDEAVIALGTGYMTIASVNFLMVAVCQPLVTALRATQQSRIPLYITAVAFVANTFLNYCLIFGNFGMPRMEIKGAALATVISRVVELLATLFFVFVRKNPLSGKLAEYFGFDAAFAARVFKNAMATTLNETLWGAGMAAQSAAYGRMDVTAFASFKAAQTISEFFLLSCFAVANAALVLIGERLGRGEYDYARALASKLLLAGQLFSLCMVALMLMLRAPFVDLFELSAQARGWVFNILLVSACMQPVHIHNAMQVTGIMRSGGDARFAAICETATIWLIRVPLAFWGALALRLPIYLVVLLCEAESLVKGIALFVRYRSGKWIKNMIGGM